MTETQFSPNQDSSTPGAPQDAFSPAANEPSHEPMVSTASTPERAPNTNTTTTISLRHKHNINITSRREEEKRDAPACSNGNRDYRSTVWVNRDSWQAFIFACRNMGYSASELINQFISSVVDQVPNLPSKTPVNFNVAIAKAEAKPVINVGEYVALKQLNDVLAESRKLRDRAEREQCSGQVLTFTREWAKSLEEGLLKALKSLKSIPPEKLQEVEAALSILKGIREARP